MTSNYPKSFFFSWVFLCLFESGLAALPAREPAPNGQDQKRTIYWNNDLDLIVKTQELKLRRVEKALDLLDIRPGMTVLDIGAGSGQATYKIAERLKGRGRVFATDIDPQLVEHVAGEARRRGLGNVYPVLVRSNGVDGFYAQYRYDLILLSHVFASLQDRVDYLRTMRGFLTDGGRLVIINELVETWPFVWADFADLKGFIEALQREPPRSPFYRYVWIPARKAAEQGGEDIFGRAVLFHLNLLQSNYRLLEYFAEGLRFKDEVSFTPEEAIYAAWRLHRLNLSGIPKERKLTDLPSEDVRRMQPLNKLLIIQRFRPYFVWDGPRPYETNSLERRWMNPLDPIPSTLEEAGYHLEKLHDLPPFQYVWIFTDGEKARPNR